MSILSSFLPGVASGLGQGLAAGISGAVNPPGGVASRGTDFNPVTNINAVGSVDLSKLGDLINAVGYNNSQLANVAASAGAFTPNITGFGGNVSPGFSVSPTILLIGVGIVAFLLWKYKT